MKLDVGRIPCETRIWHPQHTLATHTITHRALWNCMLPVPRGVSQASSSRPSPLLGEVMGTCSVAIPFYYAGRPAWLCRAVERSRALPSRQETFFLETCLLSYRKHSPPFSTYQASLFFDFFSHRNHRHHQRHRTTPIQSQHPTSTSTSSVWKTIVHRSFNLAPLLTC